MSTFGDKDPEDAYDRGDDPELRYAVLIRAVHHVLEHPDARAAVRRATLARVIDTAALDADRADTLRALLEAR